MYSVIIIDDEKSIQNGIRNYIKYMNCGFTVTQCFNNGEDALEYLKTNDPDVVITDIRMDNVSGIDIIKYIYENKPYIKTVIVSAYEEFQYARAAINYNVERFISKPTKYDEIEEVMKKIYSELDKENKTASEQNSYKNRTNYLSEILYSCILNDRKIIKDDLNELLMIMYDGNHNQVVNAKYCVFSLTLENYNEFIDKKWDYGSHGLSEMLKNFLHSRFKNTDVCFYQLDFTDNIARYIAQSCEYEDISLMNNDLSANINDVLKSLKDEIGLIARFDIVESFSSINDLVKNSSIPPTDNVDANLYNEKIINLAIEYINEHYGDDISLYTIAKHVNLNSAYFSRFFKKNTGKNFSDYLLDFRMDKAKEMIIDGNLKIEDICNKIGYRSMSYFCKTFKNVTGCTPRQFYIEEVSKHNKS
ncbi:MAG: response regulator [Clostridia bacterium]|nr:response regulator [Clostridia bacterium]